MENAYADTRLAADPAEGVVYLSVPDSDMLITVFPILLFDSSHSFLSPHIPSLFAAVRCETW